MWELKTTPFVSIADCLKAMGIFRSGVEWKAGHTPENKERTFALTTAIDQAEQRLALYLLSPGEPITASGVVEGFKQIALAYEALPQTLQDMCGGIYPIHAYEESIEQLLQDAEAIQAARQEVNISLRQMMK